MTPNNSGDASKSNPILRIQIWYALLIFVVIIFGTRLFYLQIIQHEYYSKAARAGQLKQYEIPAERGVIEAYDGSSIVPLVLNEKRYTLFADPKYIKDPRKVADEVARIIGGDANMYEAKMKLDTRYSILAKKIEKKQKEALDKLDSKGIGTREEPTRIYPQGDLAAQLLGFVDNEGVGKYGLEQALNKQLQGQPGQLRAITDAQGVPLVANKDNIVQSPKSGDRIRLTIDLAMQRQVEDILKSGLDAAKSKSGSVIVMDPKTGAVKAMANYPTYNPSEFYKVEDGNTFNNASVSSPLEVGSIMKPLTAAAALDQGVVGTNTTYFDPSRYKIGDATVTNIEEDGGAGTRSVADILELSLNTGATWLLMQMGGGEVNQKARVAWHEYMVNHFQFGKQTGIEQGYESEGTIPDPIKGFGLNIQYANTAFGQGMTATPIQMASALSAVINGGTYYRPHLVDRATSSDSKESIKKPEVVSRSVVSSKVSGEMITLMEGVVKKNYALYGLDKPDGSYSIGGKTGTAEITKQGGGYYEDKFNGTFMGFVGGDSPEYVIIVRVNEPGIKGYAGAKAAAPIFSSITRMLISSFNVTPRN